MSKRSPGRREGQDHRVAGYRAQGMKVTIPPAAATCQEKAAARPLFFGKPQHRRGSQAVFALEHPSTLGFGLFVERN